MISFSYSKFSSPQSSNRRAPARITPCPTGRLLGVALSQALRARLRSHRPSGRLETQPHGARSDDKRDASPTSANPCNLWLNLFLPTRRQYSIANRNLLGNESEL